MIDQDTASDRAPPRVMRWERVGDVAINPAAYYLVKDNGAEWRDFELRVLRGIVIQKRLEPEYVRGRPQWVAEIVKPE